MIKFLVDENVGKTVIEFLRSKGFDVKSASEFFPSRDDIFLMEKAYEERRIIITNDKDFGYLFFKSNLPALSIILLRFTDESPELKTKAIEALLNLPKDKLLHHLIVVSDDKIRIRPLVK
jgi:predicted nuclease of predicted toxin-antitoxin system